jgi:DnaK suppressor protein
MLSADLQRYKKRLVKKQRELSAGRPGAQTWVTPADGLKSDFMDRAKADAETELQIRLHQTDHHLWRAIEDALIRIRRGTFGLCEGCEKPISKSRLKAVPWARHCRNCKEHPAA